MGTGGSEETYKVHDEFGMGGGVVEHEEDGGEELQEGRNRQQPEAAEPK